VRGFATRPLGRVVLIGAAVVLTGVSFIYLTAIIGIAAMILVGLALPIYMGWKRPRGLAIAGLVILLLAAPLASALVVNEYYQPVGPASSDATNGGSVLQDATVSPFSATGASTFTFTVHLYPQYMDANTTLVNLTLFVSTCPEATLPNQTTAVCSTPYPSFMQVKTYNGTPNATQVVSFSQRLSGPNLWWWTFYAATRNSTDHINYILLDAGNGYQDVQGPVVGDFLGILGIVILPVYFEVFFYAGLVFYVVLLFYTWFKVREARRKAAQPPTAPPVAPPGTAALPTPAGAPAAAAPAEQRCPKCSAVVYPNETQCWKCGTPLTGGPSAASAPLPSGGQPPAG
jgi:hypothetical protein